MKENAIARPLPRSLTLTIAGKVHALEKEGKDIVKFNIGEPDFPTPSPIKEAGITAIRENKTTYTAGAGIPDLRKAIARDLKERFSLDYNWREIGVTIGGKFALSAAVMALVAPGDEVIIPAPYFLSYPSMVSLAGGIPKYLHLKREEGFLPDPEALAGMLTPKSRLLILNTPHNPTGAVYPRERLEAIGEVLKGTDVTVLSDEVYESLIFDGLEHTPLASIEPLTQRVLMVNSFSKTYCMTGWRMGYIAGPAPIVEAVTHIQSHMASSPTTISQYAALEALNDHRDTVERMHAAFQERRDLICSLIDSIPDLPYVRPQSTFYIFPDVRAYLTPEYPTDGDLALYLLEEWGVAVVPGEVFGAPGFIRLAFATGKRAIEEGITRMKKALTALRR